MNWYSRSILNRVLSVVIAANLVVVLVAGYYFNYSLQAKNDYHRLASQRMVRALEAQDILSEFKTQVQEWKNVLIRGSDAGQRTKYWTPIPGSGSPRPAKAGWSYPKAGR